MNLMQDNSVSLTFHSAKPTDIPEPEPEKEFTSSLPNYDLPTKRGKTDLEQYDNPEKFQPETLKSTKDELNPDWDRLKKKPISEKKTNEISLGKGIVSGKQNWVW